MDGQYSTMSTDLFGKCKKFVPDLVFKMLIVFGSHNRKFDYESNLYVLRYVALIPYIARNKTVRRLHVEGDDELSFGF